MKTILFILTIPFVLAEFIVNLFRDIFTGNL